MPTVENPLLRFYPIEEDVDDEDRSNEIPGMMSDEAKHSERSSPMTDFHTESASGGISHEKADRVIFTWLLLIFGTLFLKAIF